MIGQLDEVIRLFISFDIAKLSGYVKTFKDKSGDKNNNNKFMSSRVDDDQLFKKYKTIWSKNEDLKNIWLDSLPVYDDGYIKNKTRTYGDNF